MKNLNHLNYFFVGLPITLCLIGYIDVSFLFYGLLSTILTGFYQSVIGLKMLLDEPKDKNLRIYITCVILFFIFWLGSISIGYSNFSSVCLLVVPPILAIYFSVIIYKKANL